MERNPFASGAASLNAEVSVPCNSAAPPVAVSAAMFTIGYAGGMVTAVVGGVARDLTDVECFAFLPVALSALSLIVLTHAIGFDRR